MRTWLLCFAVLCFCSGPVCRFAEAADEAAAVKGASRPNIVMIVSDDQAWTDYGFMKHAAIQTPHLDRLAARSALFRRGYSPTPLCRPSLMSMITGLYPHQHGVTGNDPRQSPALPAEQYAALRTKLISAIDRTPTIPKRLSELGYVSLQTGKWWEGNYSRGGFTHGMTRGFPQPGGRHGDDGLEIGRKGLQPIREFVDRAVTDQKPFFVWYAPILPHSPHTPPARLLKKYQTAERPIELARYFAMCEWFDETCGELLDYLDQKQLSQNTLVIYVTDNGWIQATPEMQLGREWSHGFAPRSKQTPYEGGIRTPIMFSWPGKIPPADLDVAVSTIDVYPTVMAATGLTTPETLPGKNLLPLMTEQQPLERPFLCGESYSHDVVDLENPEASLITRWCLEGRWKLILTYPAPEDRYSFVHAVNEHGPQLFDVQQDPFEQKNLAKEHADVVQRLTAALQATWKVEKSALQE